RSARAILRPSNGEAITCKDRGSAGALPRDAPRRAPVPPIGTAFSYNRAPVCLPKFPVIRHTAFDLDSGDSPLAIHLDLLTQAAPPTVAVELEINGSLHRLDLDPRATLLDTLRERIGLEGAKKGCDHGQCGACTIHIDGRRVLSCLS